MTTVELIDAFRAALIETREPDEGRQYLRALNRRLGCDQVLPLYVAWDRFVAGAGPEELVGLCDHLAERLRK